MEPWGNNSPNRQILLNSPSSCMKEITSYYEKVSYTEGPDPGNKRTAQPYTQTGLAHMSTNGCMGGGWSFAVPLNLALIDPFDAPHIQMKGCHVAGDGNFQGLRDSCGWSLLCWYAPSAMGVEDSRSTFTFWGSCGGGLDAVAVGDQ